MVRCKESIDTFSDSSDIKYGRRDDEDTLKPRLV